MRSIHETNHLAGLPALSFALAGLAVVVQSSTLLLCAGVTIAFAGYARFVEPTNQHDPLALERSVGDIDYENGTVSVTLTVENVGESFLPDVRVNDSIPPGLDVIEGSASGCAPLGRNESFEIEYLLSVSRGTHRWGPTEIVLPSISFAHARTYQVTIESEVETALKSSTSVDVPLRRLTNNYAGRVKTETGGSGIEFFATRQYRRGDPLRRIDWHRLAKSGELSTVDYRQERGVTVVLLIDARKGAYMAPSPESTHAVDRSVRAVSAIFSRLLDEGNHAGIAVFGREDVWFPPGAGGNHRARGYHLLTDHQSLSSVPPESIKFQSLLAERREELLRKRVHDLHARLPADAQVFCFSPCCDDYMMNVAYHLHAHGHLLTLISPDPTTDDTPGRYLARLAREDRLLRLNRSGIRVIDWKPDESIDDAFIRPDRFESMEAYHDR